MRWANAPESLIQARIARHTFYVDHENWLAWCLFLDCATQWRRETVITMGMSKPLVISYGLDYTAVESVLRLSGIKRKSRKDLFEKIRLIEIGAIEGFSTRTD